ncbi:MAG: hypothetical protein ACR2HI_05890 [Gaiella sp.]
MRDIERLLRLFAEAGLEALIDAVTSDDHDWLAVYLEFGRRLKAEAALRERWKTIAPQEARDQSRGSGPSGPHRRIADYEPIPSSSAYARS